MWMWIRNLLLAGMLVLIAAPVWGEYYQYTDEKGILRFTDNLAGVPPDQRPDVKTYESVRPAGVQTATGTSLKEKGPSSLSTAEPVAPASAGTWEERFSQQADELDRMQADLNQTFMALQNERTALEAKEPAAGSSPEAFKAYRKKVDALNANIKRYESQLLEFKEKQTVFNAQYRK